jgi:hypothetical protein
MTYAGLLEAVVGCWDRAIPPPPEGGDPLILAQYQAIATNPVYRRFVLKAYGRLRQLNGAGLALLLQGDPAPSWGAFLERLAAEESVECE